MAATVLVEGGRLRVTPVVPLVANPLRGRRPRGEMNTNDSQGLSITSPDPEVW
jgi:hypothetical protein